MLPLLEEAKKSDEVIINNNEEEKKNEVLGELMSSKISITNNNTILCHDLKEKILIEEEKTVYTKNIVDENDMHKLLTLEVIQIKILGKIWT